MSHIHTTASRTAHRAIAAAIFALGIAGGVTACGGDEDDSMIDSATERAADALDMRENEEMKDAAEDASSAMENAGDAVEEKAEDMKEGSGY